MHLITLRSMQEVVSLREPERASWLALLSQRTNIASIRAQGPSGSHSVRFVTLSFETYSFDFHAYSVERRTVESDD